LKAVDTLLFQNGSNAAGTYQIITSMRTSSYLHLLQLMMMKETMMIMSLTRYGN